MPDNERTIRVAGGHRYQSSFDVVSSTLYMFSMAALLYKVFNLMNFSSQVDIILSVFTLFSMFHLIRMYYYLYLFDVVDAVQDDHFISRLFGFYGIFDRFIRVSLAVLVIWSVTFALEQFQLFSAAVQFANQWVIKIFTFASIAVEDTTMSTGAVAAVSPYLLVLMFVFLLLIVWDMNCCWAMWRLSRKYPDQYAKVSKTYKRFYYLKKDGFLYFGMLKFYERLLGLATSVMLLTSVATAQPMLLFFAGIGCAIFILIIMLRDRASILSLVDLLLSPFHYVFMRPSSWRK